ncbi:MAG TPA: type III-A CRISPR-associated RAMP protein Csm5 [Candidatus Paceibacterota bacterium]|nr:type III-A CRISPR-associated RAMP protein Csm5 [Candidatus Paceibacterota bacterium]
MDTLNKNYDLQIEVLTPLHVGAGAEKDWVQGSDFIVDNNQVKILNLKKVSQFVNISDLTNALLTKNGNELKTKLAGNLSKCVDKQFTCNYSGPNNIKTIIKNGFTNNPIIPGSSVKGALRSILAEYLLDGSRNLNEQALFGKANDGDEFMRFLKVSDAAFENTTLVNTKIFNLRSTTEGGWKFSGPPNSRTNPNFQPDGFNTFYEVIAPKEKASISISIADKAFDNYSNIIKPFESKKNQIINTGISGLFKIVNAHTKKYLEKEKSFFKKYSTDKTDKIIENIDFLIHQIPSDGEYCILKMAAGSGFHSITGDWQFDDYSIDQLYSEFTDRRTGQIKTKSRGYKSVNGKFEESAKSRKIAIHGEDFSLMGFVKLKIKTVADIQFEKETLLQRQKEQEERRIAEEQALAAQIQVQKQKEQAELELKYKAEKEAKEAEERRIAEKKRIEEEKKAKEAEEEKQRQLKRENDIKAGLVFLNNIDTFDKVGSRVSDWLKKSGNTVVPESEYSVLKERLIVWFEKARKKPRDLKEFEKFFNNKIKQWVGDVLADKWSKEIIQK